MNDHQKPRRTHAQARAEMRAGIIREGNRLLVRNGAAGLSVREIARELGVASSAIYRHVANRDELLTLLLVDAFTEVADLVEAELTGVRGPGPQLESLARTLRGWALGNPEKWALAYGSPVPGYAAPRDQTVLPGTRVMARFLKIIIDGFAAETGAATLRAGAGGPSEELRETLERGAAEIGIAVHGEAAYEAGALAIELWPTLLGLISSEVFAQLGPELTGFGGEILERWLARTRVELGMS